MPDDPNQKGVRSIKSAAEFLDVSRVQIYRLINAEKLDAVKLGRSTRVTQESLDRLINEAPKK